MEQFPFHYFSPARAELVSLPERQPLPITDRRIYFPLTCCCSGQTTNEHAFTFSFRKKNVALFFLFSDWRKKRLVRYENFARYGLVVIATEAFCFYRASGADVTSSVELCRITTICCLICILRYTCAVLRLRFYLRNFLS